jgi:hypothetical protein
MFRLEREVTTWWRHLDMENTSLNNPRNLTNMVNTRSHPTASCIQYEEKEISIIQRREGKEITQTPPCVLRNLKISVWFSDGSYRYHTEARCVSRWSVERSRPTSPTNHFLSGQRIQRFTLPFCVQAELSFNFKNPSCIFPASLLFRLLYLFLRNFLVAAYRNVWLQCCHGNRLGDASNWKHSFVASLFSDICVVFLALCQQDTKATSLIGTRYKKEHPSNITDTCFVCFGLFNDVVT